LSIPVSLIKAILREAAPSDADAQAVLTGAARLAVDPIDYCIHRHGLTAASALERSATWAGLAFSAMAPRTASGSSQIRRIDSLAEIRTIRARLGDDDVVYCAPRFEEFLRLSAHMQEHPEQRERLCIVPIDALRAELADCHAPRLLDEARQRLARRWPFASAHLDLPIRSRINFVVGILAVTIIAALAPFWFKPVFMPLVGILLVVPAIMRLIAVIRPRDGDPEPARPLRDAELPVYSVLIPLRDEAQMVPLLRRAMGALDYPPERLDIKFVVEERSEATIAAVRAVLGEQSFELVIVPDAPPHTKPKALNYALPLVRGEFVVVYDAEDIPAPDQLRRAASELIADPGLDCLQAELLVDNAPENWLTALFAGEYAGQFGLLLPFLASLRLPMPLGGTSNHFRTRSLREMGGWDAFNVTEDADLGTRLSRLRYRTGTLSSQTREEAPISLLAWMAQRTRWMKGWMQTFIVHNRSPRRFLEDIGWRGFLAFEIYIGSMIVSALLHSVFLASFVTSLVFGVRTGQVFDVWDVVSLLILLVGYGGAGALVVVGLLRVGQARLLPHQLGLPIYWVLHSIATLRALHELLVRPYFWAKTEHGRTRMRRSLDGDQSS
jgi:cellulose synthase/poly-beta-1,6-N-acetylglucosamine synthase-like glycosyltransferase